MDIAFIINSFNRLALLEQCLEAIVAWLPESQLSNRIAIVIYEAGSTDGSLEWLENKRTSFPLPINVIQPEPGEDTSFAAGLNAGVSYAINSFPSLQYLLFYETDNQIKAPQPLYSALDQLAKEENLAACGFTVTHHNGEAGGAGSVFPKLVHFALGQKLVNMLNLDRIPYKWQEGPRGTNFSLVDVVYTSPLLVKLSAWKESGGLDANLFPFADCDVDWAKRLRNLGWRMGVIKTNLVIHDNLSTLSAWSKSRSVQFHRGRLRYFKRHLPNVIYLIWPFLLLARHIMEWLVIKIFVRNPTRKKNLSQQSLFLIKSCFNGYS